ncbi:MAG: TIGR02996 domain-containing protein [Myxococcales bacterium]
MSYDFEPFRSFLPTPELRAQLDEAIAALGELPPASGHGPVPFAVALGRVAQRPVVHPTHLPVPKEDPSPLAPWLMAHGLQCLVDEGSGSYWLKKQLMDLWRFEARALPPLLHLSASPTPALRKCVFPALASVARKSPELVDDAVIEVLVNGVADTSVHVRMAAFDALSRYQDRAKPALAKVVPALSGKRLELTREALARLGAPLDESDAPPVPDAEDVQLLAGLLELWGKTRAPEVADLLDLLSSQVRVAPVAGRSKTEKERAWHEVAKKRDPVAIAALLAVPWPSQWSEAERRLRALAGQADPRIATALVKLLQAQPYRSNASFHFYREVLRDLSALRDARQLEPLKQVGAALLSRFPGYSYLEDFRRGAEGRSLEEALKRVPATAVSEDEPVVVRARSRLAGVKDGVRQRARSEGEFLSRIYDDPDSEELRRVYADWLLEHGDVRGEFIALQCERAAGRGTPAGLRRERQILEEHEDRLAGPLAQYVVAKGRHFEQGFLSRALVALPRLAKATDESAWGTVRTLRISQWADAAERDAQTLAKLFLGPGRHVTAFHFLRLSVVAPLLELCPDPPLEDVGLWISDARAIEVKLPRLKRLGIIRHRYAFGQDDRARAWANAIGKDLWARLTHFTANDVWSELAVWHARLREMPWLLSLRVLAPETNSLLEPKGWEVRFVRQAAGGEVSLEVEAHAGAEAVDPVVLGLQRLPPEQLKAMTIVETRAMDAEERAKLTALKGS